MILLVQVETSAISPRTLNLLRGPFQLLTYQKGFDFPLPLLSYCCPSQDLPSVAR